jgi:hypothetical protein
MKNLFGKKVWILLLIMFFSISSVGSAYRLQGNDYSNNYSLKYYLSTSLKNAGYGSYGYTGALTWNYSPVVEFSAQAANYWDAEVRFYQDDYDNGTYGTAYTTPCHCSNADYTNITFWKSFDKLSYVEKQETAVHEVGHALGLDHSNVTQAVMRSAGFNNSKYPYVDDYNGLQAIY